MLASADADAGAFHPSIPGPAGFLASVIWGSWAHARFCSVADSSGWPRRGTMIRDGREQGMGIAGERDRRADGQIRNSRTRRCWAPGCERTPEWWHAEPRSARRRRPFGLPEPSAFSAPPRESVPFPYRRGTARRANTACPPACMIGTLRGPPSPADFRLRVGAGADAGRWRRR